METKKIRVSLDEVKVANIVIDLGSDIENYMSKFLSLKNHERETREILKVRNFYDSNNVSVVIMIEESLETEDVGHCREFAEQFGTIVGDVKVEKAYILDKDFNDIDSQLDNKEMYIYE